MMEVATPIMAARETKSSFDLVNPRLTVFSPTLNCCALMSLPATSFFAGALATAPCSHSQGCSDESSVENLTDDVLLSGAVCNSPVSQFFPEKSNLVNRPQLSI